MRHGIPRGFAVLLCGLARGKFTVGVCKACFMATAVCRLRGRGACMRSVGTMRFMRGVWGRLGIPRGFAMSCRAALDVRIMRIMRIMRLCDWCADCNNHPCCKSAPSPTTQQYSKPSGYTEAHPLLSDRSDRSDKSDASVPPSHHAYRRCHHVASTAYFPA